jgi:hypothetical protein
LTNDRLLTTMKPQGTTKYISGVKFVPTRVTSTVLSGFPVLGVIEVSVTIGADVTVNVIPVKVPLGVERYPI